MKTRNNSSLFETLWISIKRMLKSFVSGIPSNKIFVKPGNKSRSYLKKEQRKPNPEIHYHLPYSKPFPEKQSLLKEVKK
jgi:thiamine kinase-like enzyme